MFNLVTKHDKIEFSNDSGGYCGLFMSAGWEE